MDRKNSRHISRIIPIFFFSLFLLITVFPRDANADVSYVSLGNTTLKNDNTWHYWNQSDAAISGWTGGGYKLSEDSSVLYLENLVFSSDRDGVKGIRSYKSLKIIASGPNSIKSYNDSILVAAADGVVPLSISGDGSPSLALTTTEGPSIQASSGSFDNINITAKCKDDEHGIYCPDDLMINNCKVETSSLTAGTFKIGGSGGSLTVKTDIIVRKGDMTLNGSTVRAESGKAYVLGNLIVSAGSLTVDKGGLYVGKDLRLSGSGAIKTTAEEDNTVAYKAALQAVGKFIVNGGTLQAFQKRSEMPAITVSDEAIVNRGIVTATISNSENSYPTVQFDNTVYLQGGQFTATAGPKSAGIACQKYIQVNDDAILNASGGTGYGIKTLGSFTLNNGAVTASSQSNYSIYTEDKLQMKGGKLTMDSGSCADLVSSSNPAYLAGAIWISSPADGTVHFNQDPGYILSNAGAKASKAVLQKVDSISIKSAPTEELYIGDRYDPASLVLNVKFADGSVTPLTYKSHKDMITLDPSPNADLSPGDNPIQVSCLTKTTSFHVNVKALGGTTLKVSNTGRYVLSWERTDGATGYEIWRGKGASGSRTLLTTVKDVTSFTDTSADIYTVFNYMVTPIRVAETGTFRGENSNIAVAKASAKPVIKPPKKDDPSGTKFNLLQARSGKITKTSVQIKWKKVSGAKKYIIYGNKCGTKNKYKKLTTTTKLKLTYKKVAGKKVKKGTYYKFLVYALNSKGKVISTSKTVHVATTGGKVGNDKKVTTAAKKSKVTIKKGKTFKLKAKAIPASKKLKVQRHRKMAYETSNNKIAKVTSKGVIKAVGKGTCYVYAYTQNGVFAKIKVTVK